jgi:arginase
VKIRLIEVPYALGREGVGSGLGPARFLDAGVVDLLRASGHDVAETRVRRDGDVYHEVGAAFEINRLLAPVVRDAAAAGEMPLVLSGDCISCLGVLAGLRPGGPDLRGHRQGIVWLDAHGDFNTPETTITGFLGGMPLAAATGRCWAALCASIPGFEPVQDDHVVLVGARALDPLERELLSTSAVRIAREEMLLRDGVQHVLRPHLEALASRAESFYVHLDLDVLDPKAGRANRYAEPGGLGVEDISEILQEITRHLPMQAVNVTAYDPHYDADGRALRAGLDLARRLGQLLTSKTVA